MVMAISEPLSQLLTGMGYQIVSRSRATLRSELAHTVATLAPSQLRRTDLVDRIQSARDSIPMQSGFAYQHVLLALQGLISAVSICLAVFTFNIFTGLLVLTAAVPGYIAATSLNRVQDKMDPDLAAISRRATYLEALITHPRSASDLNSFGTGGRVAAWASRQYWAVARHERALLAPLATGQLWAGASTGILVAAALGVMWLQGATTGDAAGAMAALAGISAVRSAGFSTAELSETALKVNRLQSVLNLKAHPSTQMATTTARSMNVTSLSYTYPEASEPALCDATLSLTRGQIVAIVGANGAGKTTLVNCLLGHLQPSGGSVAIDGIDAASLEEHERLAFFGVLQQEYQRYEFTARACVGLGRSDEPSSQEVDAAMNQAHILHRFLDLPDGTDTQLGEQWPNGTGLSGGQWQRIALARVFVRNAPIWILDEPTSAIDAATEVRIFDSLLRDRSQRITIVVSHRAWTLRNMDKIYFMDSGTIAEEGTFDELVARGGRFTELFRSQVEDQPESAVDR